MAKKKDTKYYYVYVFYDIKEERLPKVFKLCKRYLNHYQNSVFKGQITPSRIIAFEREIKEILNEDEDAVTIIKIYKKEYVEETELGTRESDIRFL